MSGKKLCPLCSPADEAAARPILDALRQKGFHLTDSERKSGAVLLFLSGNFAADEALQERFFAADGAGKAVIPVDLDGAAQSELVHSALMARNAIAAQGRTAEEIAARVATAPVFEKKKISRPLGRALLAAAVLLVFAAAFWFWRGTPAQTEKRERAAALAAAQTKYGLSEEDLAEIQFAYFVADRFYYCKAEDVDSFRWDFASNSMEDDGMHWYDSADGRRLELTKYSPEELAILRLMPKLEGFDLILVDAEALPDLSTSTTLNWVELIDSSITDVSGLAGSTLGTFHCFRCPIGDYAVLTDCEQLAYVTMEFDFQEKADLSGFSPPALAEARFGYAPLSLELDLSGLKNCRALEELKIENIPCGPPEGNGPSVTDLDFLAGLPNLKRLTVESMSLLTDVSALGTLPALEELTLNDCPELRDIGALANASALRDVGIENCDSIRDFSPLGGCRALEKLRLHSGNLRDASFLSALPELRDVDLGFRRLPDLDFLAPLASRRDLRIGLFGPVTDYAGLAAVKDCDALMIDPWTEQSGRIRFAALAPYLEGMRIKELELCNFTDFDLSRLPEVTETLNIENCDLEDLGAMPALRINRLRLVSLDRLTSLEGIGNLVLLPRRDQLALEIYDCQHLTDWSAIENASLNFLQLEDQYVLPKLDDVEVLYIKLKNLPELTDLHLFDGMQNSREYGEIALLEMDALRDISSLGRLRIDRLTVPPQVKDQAEELVASGAVKQLEIAYPEGRWQYESEEDVALLDLDELQTLPQTLLGRVRTLCLAGDRVIDLERYELAERGGRVVLRDRGSGEETELMPEGGLTDLSVLAPLTGLQRLTLLDQPLETLEGIQHLAALERLELRGCPALADVSTAFTLQGLRELTAAGCPLRSLEGVQNLTELEELTLADTAVSDLAPLTALPSLRRVRLSGEMETAVSSLEGRQFAFELMIEGGEA